MPQHRAAPARPGPADEAARSGPADEAVAALKRSLAGSLSRVSDLFKTWDTDGNGTIDKFEFRRVVAELGLPNSDAASDRLFDEYDKDGSGEIQYVEYVRQSLRESLASSASRVTDLLRRWDVRRPPLPAHSPPPCRLLRCTLCSPAHLAPPGGRLRVCRQEGVFQGDPEHGLRRTQG